MPAAVRANTHDRRSRHAVTPGDPAYSQRPTSRLHVLADRQAREEDLMVMGIRVSMPTAPPGTLMGAQNLGLHPLNKDDAIQQIYTEVYQAAAIADRLADQSLAFAKKLDPSSSPPTIHRPCVL